MIGTSLNFLNITDNFYDDNVVSGWEEGNCKLAIH